MKPMTTWVKALATANEEVQEALREAHTWIPSKVFVTFETETAQRKCLAALSQGTLTAALDLGKGKMPKEYLFKGENGKRFWNVLSFVLSPSVVFNLSPLLNLHLVP